MKNTVTNLVAEWHPTRNGVLFSSLADGSHKKVWWLGACGHEWETAFYSRVLLGSACPFCSNKKVLAGFNDLASLKPALEDFWSAENGMQLSSVLAVSNKKFRWRCGEGHEWASSAEQMFRRQALCVECDRKPVVVVSKKVVKAWSIEDYPDLKASFASDLNLFTSDELNSTAVVWWRCELGHVWESSAEKRTRAGNSFSNCPDCKQGNSLAVKEPALAKEWLADRNLPLSPETVTVGSGRKVWWRCEKNHEWEAVVGSRVKGAGCPYCAGQRAVAGVNDLRSSFPAVFAELHPTKNSHVDVDTISYGSSQMVWFVCFKGHEWRTKPCWRTGLNQGCPTCAYSAGSSKPEQELVSWLESEGFIVETSNRSVLGNRQEVDIYLPDQKLAVGFNGLYWHNEDHKPKNYHRDKFLAAKDAGIRLVQVWEDDWLLRRAQVERLLLHKLGASKLERVYARRTVVSSISFLEAKLFLDEYHIQGGAQGSFYYALRSRAGELEAVLVLKKDAGEGRFLISRYATKNHVVGGFTKLLSHATKMLKPVEFVTFSDHCVSDGNLYKLNGFVVDAVLPPDYMYTVGKERKHKFGYRLKRFRNDLNLLWVEGKTERELAKLNSLHRIYDAGKTRWVKRFEESG